jgi:hypothetical protein
VASVSSLRQISQQSQALSVWHTNALLQYTIHGRWSVLFVGALDVHGSWAKEGRADRFSPVSGPWFMVTAPRLWSHPQNPPVRFRNGFPYLHVAAESNSFSPLHYIVEYCLIDLQGPVILGLNLNRIVTKVAPKSGWMLSGPSEPGRTETTRYRLLAAYPRSTGQIASDGSLDRKQPNDQE